MRIAGDMPIILISSPVVGFVFISCACTSSVRIFPSRSTSSFASGLPSAVLPEPIAISSIICWKSFGVRPSTETILSPARTPASFAGQGNSLPATSRIFSGTKPTTVDSAAAFFVIPTPQITAARSAAKSMLKNAPAALTMILSAQDALGRFSVLSFPLPPSSAPISASCGNAT